MLKESDLFVKHGYVSNNVNFAHGVLSKRVIVSIDRKKGKVIYWDVKGVKGVVKADMKTTTIKSFLNWAVADITCEEKK